MAAEKYGYRPAKCCRNCQRCRLIIEKVRRKRRKDYCVGSGHYCDFTDNWVEGYNVCNHYKPDDLFKKGR